MRPLQSLGRAFAGAPIAVTRKPGTVVSLSESIVEQAALDWFRTLGYNVVGGPDMPPGPHALRASYADAIFPSVIHGALARLNPNLPAEALDDAFRKLTRPEGSTPAACNRAFHRMAVDGVTVEYRDDDGAIRGAQVQVLDFEQTANNDWLAVNQFTRRGKQATNAVGRTWYCSSMACRWRSWNSRTQRTRTRPSASAHLRQLQTYQGRRCPSLFVPLMRSSSLSDGAGGAGGYAHRRARVVQAVAHHSRRGRWPRRPLAGDSGGDRRRRSRPRRFLAHGARLHLVRGLWRWPTSLRRWRATTSSTPSRSRSAETLRAAELRLAVTAPGLSARTRRALRVGPEGRAASSGRPACRRGLAHPGLGQEPDHGLLRGAHHPRAGDGEPDHRCAHRPQ